MSDYLRMILGGTVAGVLVLGSMAVPSLLPPAIADEEPAKTLLSSKDELWPPRFDTDNLVKFDFTIEPGVSTDVVSTRTIRKIGFGRTEFVEIVTTPGGVYSSDGLASPHIRYPGIHKQLKRPPGGRLALWTDGSGWTAFKEMDAGSFMTINTFEGGELIVTEDGNCVAVEQSVRC